MQQLFFGLLFLIAHAAASHSAVSGHYSTASAVVFDAAGLQLQTTAWNGTRGEALEQLDKGEAPFLIDFMEPSSAELPAQGNVHSMQLAEAGLCFAFHVPNLSTLTLTVDQAGWLVRGGNAVMLGVANNGTPLNLANLTMVWTVNDTLPEHFASALYDAYGTVSSIADGIAAFNTSMLGRTGLLRRDTAAAAMQLVKGTPFSFMLTSFPAAQGAGLPCAQLLLQHPQFPSVELPTSPRLGIGASEIAYPFSVPLFLIASVPFSCTIATADDEKELWLSTLNRLQDESMAQAMQQWDMRSLTKLRKLEIMRGGFATLCTGSVKRSVPSGGSSAIGNVASAWARRHAENTAAKGDLIFIDYPAVGSGSGLRGIKGNTRRVAGSDSLFSEVEYAAYPTVQFVPAISFAVSLIFNIPGVKRLVLPRCVVTGIFTGLVRYWDDPRIQAANPTLHLPHEMILPFVRSSRSGTTSIFTQGLANLDEVCSPTNRTLYRTSTWNVSFSGLQERTSTGRVVAAVAATPWSVGYCSLSEALVNGLFSAAIVDEQTGSLTQPESSFVTAALEQSTVDPERLSLSIRSPPLAYPFVGVTYWVYDAVSSGNCTDMKKALEFVWWVIESAEAKEIALALNFVPLSTNLQQKVLARLQQATCGGAYLLPQPEGSSSTVLAAVLTTAGVVLLVIALAALAMVLSGDKRDNSNAPTDSNQPFTIVFTDIQSSTSLWARLPEEMGAAVDTHHSIIRACIKDHGGYEVKTIGDAFMVAFSNPKAGVEFALAVQRGLFNNDWNGKMIDDVYGELEDEKAEEDAISASQSQGDFGASGTSILRRISRGNSMSSSGQSDSDHAHTPTGSPRATSVQQMSPGAFDSGSHFAGSLRSSVYDHKLWNGLRVRIGVHHGTGSIKHDEVTLGYDYYGTVVNTAARVEAIGHGGQIIISDAVYNEIVRSVDPEAASKSNPASVKLPIPKCVATSLGAQPLRGLDETLLVYQVTPKELSRRTFAALRIDHVADVNSDSETESTTGSSVTPELLLERAARRWKGDVLFPEGYHTLISNFYFFRTMLSTSSEKARSTTLDALASKWRVKLTRNKSLTPKQQWERHVANLTVKVTPSADQLLRKSEQRAVFGRSDQVHEISSHSSYGARSMGSVGRARVYQEMSSGTAAPVTTPTRRPSLSLKESTDASNINSSRDGGPLDRDDSM